MKKLFTLVCMAFVAMSVNAQEPGLYPVKSITWKDITWKNGNNKEDKDKNPMYFLMGTGNGYANLKAEYYYSEDKGEYGTRPWYDYIKYEEGETGLPGYGLYYKFTPSTAGTIKMNVWVNKGGDNRKVFIIKGSDGKPLTPFVDYKFEGYINGQNEVKEEQNYPIFFSADEFKAKHDEAYVVDGVDTQPYKISFNGQAVWGWIIFNVEAGESYCIYQQSSQLGFGGFEFGDGVYVASPSGALAAEFAAVVDADGKATNVTDEGSVVEFTTIGVSVKAVGGAEPESVEADFGGAGIETLNVAKSINAPMYNLVGQKVDSNFKGILIQNGQKFVNK